MKNTEREAINNLNNLLQNIPERDDFTQQIKNNVQILANGLNNLDQEVKQKTFEVLNREQLLAQRDQVIVQKEQKVGELEEKEFVRGKEELIDVLPKLYPNMYPPEYENWPNDWGRTVIDRKDITSIEEYLPNFKMQLLKNELIDILPKLFPNMYPVNYENWPQDWGRTVIENNDIKSIEKHLPNFRQQLVEKLNRSVLIEKADKEGEIARLKELLSMQELEAQNKDQLLLAKELEKQELLTQKELEKKEMLAQKEVELANKSLVKNQVIGELKEDIGLKEKEAYKLQIELLTKQLEFKSKEVELKDKALEDAHEIAKQKQIVNELKEKELADARAINELQGKLLDLKALYGHDISFSEQFSAIQFRAENSIANNDFGDIQDLSRYISELLDAERENSPSIDLSKLLSLNESPVLHVQENHVEHLIAVVNNGNFDIDQIHITHSVLLSGSSEISILEDGSI